MLSVVHFYHLWADGEWTEPVAEHFTALTSAGWTGPIHLGLVGSPENRKAAFAYLDDCFDELTVGVAVEADEGYEHVTLHALHRYVKRHGGAVMYAHTKGAHNTAPIEHVWRQYMTRHLVREWIACRTALEQGYDLAGPCYCAPREAAAYGFLKPIFGGNYWMATCEYLRSLPPLTRPERHEAEIWVCQNYGKVFSTAPFAGW